MFSQLLQAFIKGKSYSKCISSLATFSISSTDTVCFSPDKSPNLYSIFTLRTALCSENNKFCQKVH